MKLPVIRDADDKDIPYGKVCQECKHWARWPKSYGHGVCAIGGFNRKPRWALELQTCDGFEKE